MATEPVISINQSKYPQYQVALTVTRLDETRRDKDGQPFEHVVFVGERDYQLEKVEYRPIERHISYILGEADVAVREDNCEITDQHTEFEDGVCVNCGGRQDINKELFVD